MEINVFIPTIPRDFKYLDKILFMYMNGSYLPKNIILSIGSYNDKYKNFFDNLENKYNKLITIRDKNNLLSAESRNKAKNFDCDIISYHDSDDYPHPDRLKIINHFFNKYPNIVQLHHNYIIGTFNDKIFEKIDIDNIKEDTTDLIYKTYFPNGDYNYGKNKCKTDRFSFSLSKFPFSIGTGSFKKSVVDNIDWISYNFDFMYDNPLHKGQDYEFFMKVIHKYNSGLFIDSKIYYYNK